MIKKLLLPVLLVALIVMQACKDRYEDFEVNPAFTSHITAYTSGMVSAESTIQIRLNKPYEGEIEYNQPVNSNLFSFSPSISGKAVWRDNQTIEFVPDKNLQSGEVYIGKFQLGEVADVARDLSVFEFRFEVIQQAINVDIEGLRAYSTENIQWQQLIGNVFAADAIAEETLNKCITVAVNGKEIPYRWEPHADARLFTLVVDSIERKEAAGTVRVQWNGNRANIEGEGELEYEIPALGDFKVTDIQVVQHPEQYVLIRFSDPLQPNQNLRGLAYIENHNDAKTSIETNELRIYPNSRITGNKHIFISEALKNSKAYKLGEDSRFEVRFEAIKPAVRLLGKGNILPSANGMVFPFEAVNLNAVDVRIIKVYENNIAQFFQNNNYNGNSELKRVGRLIRKKTIKLKSDKPIDYGRWNRFHIDLSDYIKTDQGSIYRVELSFRKHHSTYPCTSSEDIEMDESDWDEYDDADKDQWDYISDYSHGYYYNDYFYGYNYRERENPCSYSYFRGKSVSKNIFASDLAIIAKSGTNGELHVTLSDLISAKPVTNAQVDIYDYQQQKIASVKTNRNGMVTTDRLRKTPFLIIAKHNDQKSYLRLDNGSSLSLSRFDVNGAIVQEGIKGFIYGERGVWRPGDTLFLNFILEDKEQLIPNNHPVIFELFNPKGQLVERTVRTSSMNGFYNYTTATEASAPTGNWTAKVTVGGAQFNKTLKIETVKPNRLKVNLDFGKDVLTAKSKFLTGDLQVNWLHGAPGKHLKTDISVNFFKSNTVFEDYKKYHFDDPVRDFHGYEKKIFEGTLNEKGYTKINARLDEQRQAPGMLRAVFKTRAFEKGGDFSTDQFAIPYAPYETFIGIRPPEVKGRGALETDTTNTFEIITVDKNGAPVKANNLTVELYKIEWRWWWERGSNNLASYIGRSNVRPVSTSSVSTNANGKAEATIRVRKHDWGRYLVRVSDPTGGHATGIMTYFDWPSWMSRAGRQTPDGANMLVFSSDKETYQVGETAKISFPSSKKGQALISIEDGKKVKDAFWIQTQDSETTFNLPITPDMTPNCYVHITMIQPHSQTENDAPIRLYGVIPVMVEDPATRLEPVIDMPNELAPETPFTVKIKEKDGKPMTYTIAIVDEGLLDLTRFKTPDPWNHFYSREALGVKTWDLYDWVIGAYGARLENLLTVGGDADVIQEGEQAIRFKPMVRFIGPFSLKKNKTGKHKIDMPNYIGSVRTMVIAGQDGAYGNAEKTTPVKKPLMTLATLPRVLGPTEKVKLPVTVFAMDEKVKDVKVEVKTNNLFTVQGERVKNIRFDNPGDEVVEFDLEVVERLGKATVQIIATSGKEKSTYEIELDVRNPNLPVTRVEEMVLEGGESLSIQQQLPGMKGSNSATLEISSIPPINLEKRLRYLLRYPHGCLEQTTSGAFPQLFLEDIMELDKEDKLRIQDNITAAINRIRSFQLSDGGLGYWPGANESNRWSSSYAGHFLLEAEKKGYSLPYGFKDRWVNYQKSQARRWSPIHQSNSHYYRNHDLEQAYRLYTLALAGSPELSAMNRLRERNNLSIQAAWRLAAAYQIAGKGEVAKDLVRNQATRVEPYQELSYTFGSSERDMAMIIETMTLMGEKTKAAPLVKELSENLSSNRWMSTQTTAYTLIAISRFTRGESGSKYMDFSYTYQGKSSKTKSNLPISQRELEVDENQTELTVEVTNKSDDILFARLIMTGTPLAGDETSYQESLMMDIRYKDLEGNSMDVSRLDQGMDFIAEVTVSNPGTRGYYREMALSQLFPSGWEIRNQRMDIGGTIHESDAYDYQDIRDDRVYTYFSLPQNSKKTFKVLLHAAYVGDYYQPAVRCEAMYDNSIQALKKGRWVKVVKPGM